MNINLISEIENSVQREVKTLVKDYANVIAKPAGVDVARSDNQSGNRPTVNIAITNGEITQSSMGIFTAQFNIEIVVVSTHPKYEDKRRDELYGILLAVLFRLTGLTLHGADGKQLPIEKIRPYGKFGQISEEGEQLAYKLTFATFYDFREYKPEEGEPVSLELQYFLKPYNETEIPDATDIIERSA